MAGVLGKLLSGGVKEALDSVGKVFDKNFTSKEEKLKAKAEITKIVTDFATSTIEAQKQIIIAEASGNWLQKSWRPLLMLVFAGIVVVSTFYDVHLNEVPVEFWGLLKIGVGGYVGGRSIEKVFSKMDVSIGRKDKK